VGFLWRRSSPFKDLDLFSSASWLFLCFGFSLILLFSHYMQRPFPWNSDSSSDHPRPALPNTAAISAIARAQALRGGIYFFLFCSNPGNWNPRKELDTTSILSVLFGVDLLALASRLPWPRAGFGLGERHRSPDLLWDGLRWIFALSFQSYAFSEFGGDPFSPSLPCPADSYL